MKAKEIKEILYKAIPKSETWGGEESYGAYNVNEDSEVKRVLYCVTATKEVQDHFRKEKYDLLISHHPWGAAPDIPHMIFHTALDCCEGGLNDMWRDALGIKDAQHFDKNLGWYGKIDPIPFNDLVNKIKAFAGDVIGQTYTTKDVIESVVICSGLGGLVTHEAADTKADCYITGEMTRDAKHTGIPAVIETGHTYSEWIGVYMFKKLLEPHGIVVDSATMDIDYFGSEHYNKKRNVAATFAATAQTAATLYGVLSDKEDDECLLTDPELLEDVVSEIKKDIKSGDTQKLKKLLAEMPEYELVSYLPQEKQNKYLSEEEKNECLDGTAAWDRCNIND